MNEAKIKRLEAKGFRVGTAEEFLGMETLGSIIDRLVTVDMKMWYAQEDIYKIVRMDYEEFLERYGIPDSGGAVELYTSLQKAIDLNLQRNALIDEIDEEVDRQIKQGKGNVQRKHKTY